MRRLLNIIYSAFRALAGLAVLLLAAGIPAYFSEVDREAVLASGRKGLPPEVSAGIYADEARLSAAELICSAIGKAGEPLKAKISAIYAEHPLWRISGGDEPFFEAFNSTAEATKHPGFYSLLSVRDNRKKLRDFLRQSSVPLVAKILELRKLNTTLLPPAYTSAGAPFDAALLSTALLAQTGDFKRDFLSEFSVLLEKMKGDTQSREDFEKYCLGLLTISKNRDWTQIRSLMSHFNSPREVYEFARVYSASPNDAFRDALAAALLVCGDAEGITKYLKTADDSRRSDFSFALSNGAGALHFLIARDMPIYKDSYAARLLEKFCSKEKLLLGDFAARFPVCAISLKVFLAIFGGYLFIRGLLRMFSRRRDTPKWYSPLALGRGFLEALVVALTFFVIFEPNAFTIKITTEPPPELRFAIQNIVNNIGEETMKFDSDTATLAAIGLFLVVQFLVYLICIIRIASIKRAKVPASLKLKLLENEDNLFDMGLYIGLFGTVASLILLTLGIVTASLMAGYTSTLFGILFTALVKIVHLRGYKRRLILEAESEKQ